MLYLRNLVTGLHNHLTRKMFVLAEMQDVIRVEPRQFNTNMQRQISNVINKKLANKVVHNVGLFITYYDLLHVGDSFILPGDGSSHTRVKFRAVIFRPFTDEIILGKIRSCSQEGVYVSLGFFDDILIPADSLQYPSRFDQQEQVWVWQYQSEDGTHDLFMDSDEEIRFRVVDEIFTDIIPRSEPPLSSKPQSPKHQTLPGLNENGKKELISPYKIRGTVSEPGLGLVSWWT